VLAALAVALTMLYVSSAGASRKDSRAVVTVYVAARDVAPGTPGLAVRLRAERVLRGNLAPGAVVRPEALRGLVAVARIYRGEQVTTRRFAPARAQGVLADLRGTLRAIQIAGEPEQLLVGTLRDGDRVDVAAAVARAVRLRAGRDWSPRDAPALGSGRDAYRSARSMSPGAVL
jgi:Flp pilus assembly protein CpaB